MGQDSVVGITTHYGLDRIISQRGRYFLHPSRLGLGPTQPPVQWVLGSFPKGKAAGVWCWQPTSSSAKFKERVQLYLYSQTPPSPHGLFWGELYLYLVSLLRMGWVSQSEHNRENHTALQDNTTLSTKSWCMDHIISGRNGLFLGRSLKSQTHSLKGWMKLPADTFIYLFIHSFKWHEC